MNIFFLSLLIYSFLLMPVVHAMEDLSWLENDEQLLNSDELQKIKDECQKRAHELLDSISALKKQKAEVFVAQIIPRSLFDEIDRLKASETATNLPPIPLPLAPFRLSAKRFRREKEPIAAPDSPAKERSASVEDPADRERELLEVQYKRTQPYHIPGWYFQFKLAKKMKIVRQQNI